VVNIADLQTTTPSFSVNSAGQYNSINIRGIGNGAVNPSITPGIAVQRDGLIQAETIELSEPFYDIDNVQILRGPQGTFIGQSSTGGAVLINSKSPTFDGINGYVDLLVGNYSDHKVDGAINLPISDTLAARIAFNYERRGSFYFDAGSAFTAISQSPVTDPGHVDDQNVRLSLLWKPTDSFQALLKYENNHSSTGGTPDQPNQNVYIDPTTGLAMHSPFYAYSSHQPFTLNYDFQTRYSEEESDRAGLELKYTLPDGIVVRTLTGFQHDDIRETQDQDASSANALYNYHLIGPDNNYYSQELNIISPDNSRLTWIAGGSWFYRNTPVRQNFYINNPPYPADGTPAFETQQLSIRVTQRTLGAFGQVSYQIFDPLQIQLGVRENWDNNFNQGGINIQIPTVPPFPLSLNVPLTGNFRDNVPTWKAGLNYTPIENQFIYGFVARGYKSGGTNAGSPDNFDPEHVTDYELGIKSKFLNNHIETAIGGYYMNYENLQQPVINQFTGQSGITNVGKSKIKGFEASIQAHLAGFNANLGIAYNDSSLGDVSLIAGYRLPGNASNQPQCAAGQPLGCFNYTPYFANLSGGSNPYSPKVTLDAGVEYVIPLGDFNLRPRITYSHTDKQYASLFQTDNYFLMGVRNLWGASLGLDAGQWTAQLYGTNLTNETYVTAYTSDNNLEYYGAPRQFGVRVSRSF